MTQYQTLLLFFYEVALRGFVAVKWHSYQDNCTFFFSPMPSGILMTHSELDRVQVRGTVGHVSAMIKWCSAAMLMSWTTQRLPAQTRKKCTLSCCIWYFVGFRV